MGELRVVPADSVELKDSVSGIDWQYELQKSLQKPNVTEYANLSGTFTPQPHHMQDASTVKIVNGAWDKNQDRYYEPREITVREGETLTWINEDAVVHTVTSKELGVFDSSIIAAGKEWQYEFKEQGLYEYFCTLHPWMEGAIGVE